MSIQASTAALRRSGQEIIPPHSRATRHPASGPVTRAALGLSVAAVLFCFSVSPAGAVSRESFLELVKRVNELGPDPCGPAAHVAHGSEAQNIEDQLLRQAARNVEETISFAPAEPRSAQDLATLTLRALERQSAEINTTWPEDARFHFEILDISPIFAVQMSIRASAGYYVFARPPESATEEPRGWREVGSEDSSAEHSSTASYVELYALHKGPSGSPRFLARLEYSGCAGSIGIAYEAQEWDPDDAGGHLERIIEQHGSLGLDDQVPGFEQIGELRTSGQSVSLPYCWFSAIDTWDNPSLCAVDTYDLSGDDVKFQSRVYNRPDLVPIAKAIDYAQRRDYEAVRAYCTSNQLALDLIRDFPAHFFAEDLQVTQSGPARKTVEIPGYRFEVEERDGRWLVSAVTQE